MNNAWSDVGGLDPPHLDEMFACIRDFGKAREVGFCVPTNALLFLLHSIGMQSNIVNHMTTHKYLSILRVWLLHYIDIK